MRHQYTPLFRDFLTSSMWATDPATRCVWIWMLLMADPEGYVVGTAPGVAQQAGVTIEQARAAIALLESPDPDSSTKELEGRRIVKVDRGWHIVNFVAWRERAKEESEKARKRAWAQKQRDANSQLTLPGVDIDARSETVDAPKPKPKPSSPSEKRSPQRPSTGVFEAPSSRLVLGAIPADWQPSDELRERAKTAGVQDLDGWIAKLRTGPIGGKRGVFADDLEDYIGSLFGTWRTWEETNRANANSRHAFDQRNRFGESHAPEAQPAAKRIPGLPGWVGEAHVKAAKERGVSIKAAIKGFAQSYHLPVAGLPPCDVHRPFLDYIESLAEGRAA